MTIHAPGDRVFAVRNADKQTVYLYGVGVFDGHQPCPMLGDTLNPHITLDGDKGDVWGMECWWGSEDRLTEYVQGREIKDVPVVRFPDRPALDPRISRDMLVPPPSPVPHPETRELEAPSFNNLEGERE